MKFLLMFEEIIKIRDSMNQIKAVKILLNYLVLDQALSTSFKPTSNQIRDLKLYQLYKNLGDTEFTQILVYFSAICIGMCPEVDPECFTGGNKIFQKQILDFVNNDEQNKA